MSDIYVIDNLSPEAITMLQAIKTRSSEHSKQYADRCVKEGPEFMRQLFVGWLSGITGQCGTTTVFIEGVSILAAKAIQDSRLYNGQETSTRYIDCSNGYTHDPINSVESQAILKDWMDFYRKALPLTIAELTNEYSQGEIDTTVYQSTMKARAFDIVRGFLPAGLSTQLSWSGNFDNMYNHINWLITHPLKEVSDMATTMLQILKETYPSGFAQSQHLGMTEYYSATDHYFNPAPGLFSNEPVFVNNLDKITLLTKHHQQLISRPKYVRLPATLSRYGRYIGRFTLDYGSFRDLQRHRGGRCEMPILNTDYGFNAWYIDALPASLQSMAAALVAKQTTAIRELTAIHGETIAQYLCALGYKVPVEIEYDLPQMTYVAELRSGQTVHPTLRNVAIKMLEVLNQDIPCLKLYGDTRPTEISYHRGTQTLSLPVV